MKRSNPDLKHVLFLFLLAAGCLAAACSVDGTPSHQAMERSLTVSGEGVDEATPARSHNVLSVSAIDRSAIAAQVEGIQRAHIARMQDREQSESPAVIERDKQISEATGIPYWNLNIDRSRHGTVSAISSLRFSLDASSGDNAPSDKLSLARAFLREYKEIFGIADPDIELVHSRTKTDDESGMAFIRFDQVTPQGVPVRSNGVGLAVADNGGIVDISAWTLPTPLIEFENVILADEAIQAAAEHSGLSLADYNREVPARLEVINAKHPVEGLDSPTLVWNVGLETDKGPLRYYIDASDGTILHVQDVVRKLCPREVYADGDPNAGDRGTLYYRSFPYYYIGFPWDTWEGYVGMYYTQLYFENILGRNCWDDGQGDPAHARFRISTNYSDPWFFAGWVPCNWIETGSRCTVFLSTGQACVDIIAHEFTHGVSESDGAFDYVDELSVSMSEGYSDVMSQFVEVYQLGGTDWVMGAPMFAPGMPCTAFRDLDDPENPNCPSQHANCHTSAASWDNYNRWGIYHYNAGIMGKAGQLMGRESSEGTEQFAGISVQGIGSENAAGLWHYVVHYNMYPWSTYVDFRYYMIRRAETLFPYPDWRLQEVRDALDAVGIWSRYRGVPFQTDYQVSLADFTSSSGWHKYIFYAKNDNPNPDWGNVYYRTRTCSLQGTCSWGAETWLSFGEQGPSSVVFDGKLWVFNKYDYSDQIYYHYLDSSDIWHKNNKPGGGSIAQTDSDPSAVVLDNKIWLFYKVAGTGEQSIAYWTYDTTNGWINQGTISTAGSAIISEHGPAAVTLSTSISSISLFYNEKDYDPISYTVSGCSHIPGSGYWSNIPVGLASYRDFSGARGTPSATTKGGRVYVSSLTSLSGGGELLTASKCNTGTSCTYREGEWSNAVVDDDDIANFVTLFGDIDGYLYRYTGYYFNDYVYRDEKRGE